MSTRSSESSATGPGSSSTTASPSSTSATAASTTNPSTSASPTTPSSSAGTSPSSASSTGATTGSSASATSAQSSTTPTTAAAASVSPTVIASGETVITVTPTVTTTSTPQNNSSNSFFSNKSAVIGVFTVVGVVVVVIVVALVVNAIRRRRAQKFDRDVAEAAAEAMASSNSPFDDYAYTNNGAHGAGGGGPGAGTGGYGYSENSHGTYQSPPMQPSDAYGMSEMSQYDPYAAGAASLAAAAAVDRSRSRKDSEPGAPGIAGVGARNLAREPSRRAPYHAFAGPGPQPHELQTSNGTTRSQRGMNQDVLEAVGLTRAGTATITGPNPNTLTNPTNGAGAFVTRKPSDTTQSTHFSGRSQFGSLSSHHPAPLQPGYAGVDSYYPQRHDSLSPDPFAAAYAAPAAPALPNPHDSMLLPPSPSGQQSDHNEDLPELGSSTALRSEEQRSSYQDDTDYSQGNRILRVANQ